MESKKFVIETENATIQVDPQRSDLVEMKRIDGRRFILVAVEGEVTVNGVEVNIPYSFGTYKSPASGANQHRQPGISLRESC